MDIDDIERLVDDCELAAKVMRDTDTFSAGQTILCESAHALRSLLERAETAEAEVLEQARLNGMGADRELALIARVERAEKDRDLAYRKGQEDMKKRVLAIGEKQYNVILRCRINDLSPEGV